MKRLLLITTAISSLMAANALAQSETSVQPDDMTEDRGSSFFMEDEGVTSADGDSIYFAASADQFLTTNILGQTIYNGTSDEAQAIGNVNDIILAPNGSAEAVVIGVGGFLGIGEKEVAVSFENIQVFDQDDGTWLTVDAGREDLEAAPAFDRTVFEGRDASRVADGGTMGGDLVPTQDPALADDPDTDIMGGSMDEELEVSSAERTEADADGTADLTPVELDALSASALLGARAFARDDQDIGEIGDIIFNEDGSINAYVVDVGGFLGIGEKPVAVAAADLEILRDHNGWLSVHTNFSKRQLEEQPAYDAEAYFNDPDSVVLR